MLGDKPALEGAVVAICWVCFGVQVLPSNVSHRRMSVLLTLPQKWENRSRELQQGVKTAKFIPWLMDPSLSLQAVSSSSSSIPVPLPSQAPANAAFL